MPNLQNLRDSYGNATVNQWVRVAISEYNKAVEREGAGGIKVAESLVHYLKKRVPELSAEYDEVHGGRRKKDDLSDICGSTGDLTDLAQQA